MIKDILRPFSHSICLSLAPPPPKKKSHPSVFCRFTVWLKYNLFTCAFKYRREISITRRYFCIFIGLVIDVFPLCTVLGCHLYNSLVSSGVPLKLWSIVSPLWPLQQDCYGWKIQCTCICSNRHKQIIVAHWRNLHKLRPNRSKGNMRILWHF